MISQPWIDQLCSRVLHNYSNGTFTIVVRQNGASYLDFESTFGTWSNAVVFHGKFHRGTRKKGSSVKFEVQDIGSSGLRIYGDGDMDDGNSFKLDITVMSGGGAFQVTGN